jgi:hypothetical protein
MQQINTRDRELTFLSGSRSFVLGRRCFLFSTSKALSGSGDDELEDGSFFLCHLFLFFFLTGFSDSSISFGFFILILFRWHFFFSYFSSKRGCPEANANISFLPAK